MTPKEKAQYLVNKFTPYAYGIYDSNSKEEKFYSKLCAIVAVDEMINVLSNDINPLVNYWFEVKKEIKNL